MPVRGFALTETPGVGHLGEQAVLAAMQQAIPDDAIDAVIAEAGTQERRKRRLPARLPQPVTVVTRLRLDAALYDPGGGQPLPVRQAAWYPKPLPTFVDTLALVRRELWAVPVFSLSPQAEDRVEIPRALWDRMTTALGYAA